MIKNYFHSDRTHFLVILALKLSFGQNQPNSMCHENILMK